MTVGIGAPIWYLECETWSEGDEGWVSVHATREGAMRAVQQEVYEMRRDGESIVLHEPQTDRYGETWWMAIDADGCGYRFSMNEGTMKA